MRVVFLEVDGVLNYDGCRERFGDYLGVEDECVARLAQIVNSVFPPAAIVLTSGWKELWDHHPLNAKELDPMARYLVMKLRAKGLRLTDRTEEKDPAKRGLGIKGWMRKVGDVEGWVVLDDEVFGDYEERGVMPHLVRTGSGVGLSDKDVQKAIKILRGE